MRVGVIGAGPAGLTAAYRLASVGVDVSIFEAGPHVGGMARSFDLWDHRVDLGPHRFFSKDQRVNALWHELIGEDFRLVERQTRIFFRGRYFDYPLRIGNVIANLAFRDVARSLVGYAVEQLSSERPADRRLSFEDWAVHSFGRPLFEMFFRSYSEKLWGISCAELDRDFAAQRIRRFSLGQSILAALGIGRDNHKTLVEIFAYPKRGSGEVYDRMIKAIGKAGGRVLLETPIVGISVVNGAVSGVRTAAGAFHACEHIVSTMPLTLLVQGLGDVPAPVAEAVARLRFRNTILVYLKIEAEDLFPDQWLYIHSDGVKVGRVTNFNNWLPELCEESSATVLALEYWCYDGDAIWDASHSELITLAEQELRSIGLLGSARVADGHVERLRRCYPVYSRGYRDSLAPVVEHLRTIGNLWPIGRYGAFKYNNQDHSILMGLLAAENIAGGKSHDLWAINSDYDSYQEDGEV